MRTLLLTLLVALALPVAALASPRDKGDGTLAVKRANGTIQVVAKGTVIGRVDDGKVWIADLNPLDTNVPQVFGYDKPPVVVGEGLLYHGTGLRFRFVGGRYAIRVVGSGIDLAAVGQGKVTLKGAGTADDGQYSLDGGAFQDVPAVPLADVFGQSAPAGTLGG